MRFIDQCKLGCSEFVELQVFYEPTDNLFLAQLALFDPNAVSSYRIELEAFRDGASVASTGINIDVAPIPLPAPAFLLLGGRGALAALRRRTTAVAG